MLFFLGWGWQQFGHLALYFTDLTLINCLGCLQGARFVVELPLTSMLSDTAASKMPAIEPLSAAVLASNREKRLMRSAKEGGQPCSACSGEPCT